MRAIVADDSQVMRLILEKILREIGYETMHAANGQEVLTLLEKGTGEIDLILLDWNMPKMSGFEVLGQIRERYPSFNIPVLMVSTESEEERVRQALEAGAAGYISKPFTAQTLAGEVQRVRRQRGLE
jgi:two-component system, chemotaxis family, chemotaxis protein CheY